VVWENRSSAPDIIVVLVASPAGDRTAPGRRICRRPPWCGAQALVGQAVREHLGDTASGSDRNLISSHVVRVELQADQLAVELTAPNQRQTPQNRAH
jgi:hypothetical protein